MAFPSFTGYQKKVLLILTLVNFVNYVDREIIFTLVPLIQADFALTYAQVSLLGTVFSIVHSLCTLPLGVLADRISRKKVISYGVFFWSAMTFLSGLVPSFRSLLAVRALVGLGEAAYAPAATAIITGTFLREVRARVQGVFDLGMFIGGAMGLALGGILAEWVGWRPAFFIVGVPGLLLALTILRLPEPPGARRDMPIPLRDLLRVPAYMMVLIGGWFITFAAWVYIFWGPTFVTAYKGFRLREAGLILGGTLTLAGVLGVMTGAALADRLARRFAWGRVLIIGIGFLTAAPLLYISFHTPSKATFLVLFFLGSFFMTWYHGPLTATMHDLTPARAHATAVGLYYFFVNFFATTWAPLVSGQVADRYDLLAGLHLALAAQIVGALCFFAVIYFIRRDGLRHPRLARYLEPSVL
ncbi:MAG: MFS transporter [Acidobacteria bacterium]|nr:MFS transporter [Acidobacteriota bacterium]